MTQKTLPKPASSNKQVQEYIAAAEKGYNSLFVIPTAKGWSIQLPSTGKTKQTYATKAAAISGAKKLATREKAEIFIFDEAGELIPSIATN